MFDVYVERMYAYNRTRIYISYRAGNTRVFFVPNPEALDNPLSPAYLQEEVDISTSPDPGKRSVHFMELQNEWLGPLVKALTDAGVRPPEQSFTEGKLVATEKHLEDMRRLVFEAPPIVKLDGE